MIDLKKLPPTLTIVNLVATAELKQPVTLKKLVGVRDFSYDTAIYRCAYLKDKNTKSKISIFSSGKMISVGSKSFQNAKRALNYASKRLAALGLVAPTRLTVQLQNVVATSDMGKSMNLESLSLQLPNLIYEPQQFSGAIYYAKELEGASILIFANGKVVIAGLRRVDLLETARQVLVKIANPIG